VHAPGTLLLGGVRDTWVRHSLFESIVTTGRRQQCVTPILAASHEPPATSRQSSAVAPAAQLAAEMATTPFAAGQALLTLLSCMPMRLPHGDVEQWWLGACGYRMGSSRCRMRAWAPVWMSAVCATSRFAHAQAHAHAQACMHGSRQVGQLLRATAEPLCVHPRESVVTAQHLHVPCGTCCIPATRPGWHRLLRGWKSMRCEMAQLHATGGMRGCGSQQSLLPFPFHNRLTCGRL